MTENKVDEILAKGRVFTQYTGTITDFQVKNLKVFFLGISPQVTIKGGLELGVEFDKKELHFFIKKTSGKGPKDYVSNLKHLQEYVYRIVGSDWKVKVYRKSKLIYTGKRLEKVQKPLMPVKGVEYD